MTIINLTQHNATPEQLAQSVVNLEEGHDKLVTLLTFNNLPTHEEIEMKASAIAEIADGYGAAMIGGAPYLMPALTSALKKRGIKPLFAFTERVSVDKMLPDGSVQKTSMFAHKGFVEA